MSGRSETQENIQRIKTEWYLVLSGKLPSGSGSVPFKRTFIIAHMLSKSNILRVFCDKIIVEGISPKSVRSGRLLERDRAGFILLYAILTLVIVP